MTTISPIKSISTLRSSIFLFTFLPQNPPRIPPAAINAKRKTEKAGTVDVKIEIKEIKDGRKVKSIDFIVKDFDKRKYFKTIPTVEVPTVLKDGIKDVEVMQQRINLEALQTKKNAPHSATMEAFVCLPANVLSLESSQDFIKFCYELNCSFTDLDFNNILLETQELTNSKKGLKENDLIDNKLNNSYSYFKSVFKNKLENHLNNQQVQLLQPNKEVESEALKTFLKKYGKSNKQ